MKVTIYTKNDCIYCTKAKMLLTNKNISYNEMKLNEDFSRQNLLELFPSAKTFPVIVIELISARISDSVAILIFIQ